MLRLRFSPMSWLLSEYEVLLQLALNYKGISKYTRKPPHLEEHRISHIVWLRAGSEPYRVAPSRFRAISCGFEPAQSRLTESRLETSNQLPICG